MDDTRIVEHTKTAKGEYVIYTKDNKKYFKKQLYVDILSEIEGYNLIKNYYNLPKLIDYNLNEKTITYEYKEELRSNTLHHALFTRRYLDINKIIELMTFSFKDFKFNNENLSANSRFFIGRIKDIVNYLDSNEELFTLELVYNKINLGCFKNIVKKVITGISKNQTVPFIISQGDPTDLNFSADCIVTDFEVAGENSVINEVAIFVGCYVVNCYYFYIKYMNSAHANFKDTLKNYKDYVKCSYKVSNKTIRVGFKNIIPSNVKCLLIKYLEKVDDIGIIPKSFNLGCYIALRFINPVNLNCIKNKNDKILLMTLCGLFVEKYRTLSEIIKFIKGL